jgi:hypothetical protein
MGLILKSILAILKALSLKQGGAQEKTKTNHDRADLIYHKYKFDNKGKPIGLNWWNSAVKSRAKKRAVRGTALFRFKFKWINNPFRHPWEAWQEL